MSNAQRGPERGPVGGDIKATYWLAAGVWMPSPKVKQEPQNHDRPKVLRREPPASDDTDDPRPVEGSGAAALLVPASMVGEVLYCERLMYLAWVQGESEDNAYLVEGRHVHRRADRPGGTLPEAAETIAESRAAFKREPAEDENEEARTAEPTQVRSLWLSSERLGLTARCDVVEGDAEGRVVPIEYKRGKLPEHLPEQAYPSVRAQVCAQGLLLREHGYRCDEGAVYYAGSKRRVPITLDDELVQLTLGALARARELAHSGQVPPPLEDSPKCPGCSLNPICLPDEVALLRRLRSRPDNEQVEAAQDYAEPASRGEGEPGAEHAAGATLPEPAPTADGVPSEVTAIRRLQPARDDRLPVYVTEHRAKVRVSGERLAVETPQGTQYARLVNTSQLAVFGNAQVTTQALRTLMSRGIPVSYFTTAGYFVGRASGQDSNNVELRLAQYRLANNPSQCLALAKQLVVSKIRNARVLLRRNHTADPSEVLQQLAQCRRQAERASDLPQLLGCEGAAARAYFSAFSGLLKVPATDFSFDSRNRRPPKDPINALLSLLYALLAKEYTHTLATVGLDPLLGFYHQPRFGRPALALDLMEELRPVIADSVVLQAVNNRIVGPDDFVRTATSCALRPQARRPVIAAYERRLAQEVTHPLFGYRISYRRVLEVQARLLSRVLLGELNDYPSFTIR